MDKILAQVVVDGERAATSSRRPRPRSTCWSGECAGHVPAAFRAAQLPRRTSRPTPTARSTTEATVKLRVGDEVRHEVAEGDGPVNALDAALRKALNGTFPNLRDDAPGRLQGPRHQLRGRHGRRRPRGHRKPATKTTSGAPSASARTSSRPAGSPWSTAIEYKLCKDEEQSRCEVARRAAVSASTAPQSL